MSTAMSARARAVAVTAVAGLAVTALAALPSTASATADPAYLRTLGGPGHAELYPSGLEVGASGAVVVADTGNDRVSSYTTAGTRSWSFTATTDGRRIANPRDIAVDSTGAIYVADDGNARIVKLTADGQQVGNPWWGPSSDRIKSPIGLTEKNGLVYVADGVAKKVRVFDRDGAQVRTIASSGVCQLAALRDVDADSAGNVYVANYTNNDIVKFGPTGTCITKWGSKGTGPGQFKNPYGVRVATDPFWGESVYVADSNNNRAQIFSLTGTHRATVGVDGTPTQPGTITTMRRVAVAADGDVLAADLWGSRVLRYDRTSGGFAHVQTIGNGLAPLTPTSVFNEVRGVDFDALGNVHAVDTVNQRIVRMDVTGQILGSCGGRSEATTSPNWPRGIAVDRETGDRWMADTKQNRIQVLRNDCTAVARFGSFGTATNQFNWPHAISIRQTDRVAIVADTKNNRVVAYDVVTRTPLHAFGTKGSGSGQFFEPRGISVAPSGAVHVADTRNHRVVELTYSKAGGFGFVRVVNGGLLNPEGVAVEADGTIWVADTGNNRVVSFTAAGTVATVLTTANGIGYAGPAAVSIDTAGRIYVSDTQNDRIVVLTVGEDPGPPAGNVPQLVKTVHSAGLADMYPVDVTYAGGRYYVVDPGRYRVVAVDATTGAQVAEVGGVQGQGAGQLSAARAVSNDAAGNVYVADSANNRVQVFDANLGFLRQWGSLGDAEGQFQTVYGIAVGQGKGPGGAVTEVVYTADDDRVQKFTKDGSFLSVFATGLNEPRQLAVRPGTTDLYVVNARDREVVVYDVDGTVQFRFGSQGTGPGQFGGDPRGIAFTDNGATVFVTDDANQRVQAFDAATGAYLYQVTGFTDPRGLTAVGSKLVVCDEWDYSIKEFDLAQASHPMVRRLFGNPPPQSGVNSPRGLDVDATGRLFVTDWWNQRVVRTDATGGGFLAWGQRGPRTQLGAINFAWDVAVQPTTGWVYVANRESHEIEVFKADGTPKGGWGSRGSADGKLEFPNSLAFAPDGTLLVTDSGNNRIQRFTIDGEGVGTWQATYGSFGSAVGQFSSPIGVDVAADGTVWVADQLNGRLQARNPATGAWTAYVKPGGVKTFAPRSVTVAPDGSVWATDGSKNLVFKLAADGSFQFAVTGQQLGAGALAEPFDIAFGTQGRIYLSDLWNNRVLMLQ